MQDTLCATLLALHSVGVQLPNYFTCGVDEESPAAFAVSCAKIETLVRKHNDVFKTAWQKHFQS